MPPRSFLANFHAIKAVAKAMIDVSRLAKPVINSITLFTSFLWFNYNTALRCCQGENLKKHRFSAKKEQFYLLFLLWRDMRFLKKMVVLNIIALVLFTAAALFLSVREVVLPDALIYSFFGAFGVENVVTALLRMSENKTGLQTEAPEDKNERKCGFDRTEDADG